VGFWSHTVVPRATDLLLSPRTTGEVRARVCDGLSGTVLELGCGSGPNCGYYPPGVTEVWAVEPSDVHWRRAQKRIAATHATVTRAGLDGQFLALADASADSALSTWTLCTIPNAFRALQEVRRVLRPGGTLHFVEHGLSPSAEVARWQHRLDPVQQALAAGCHLTRRIDALLEEAGFTLDELATYDAPGAPKPFSWFYEGVGRSTSMATSASPS